MSLLISKSKIVIESKRLILKRMTLSDVNQRYLNWVNDPEVNRYLATRNKVYTLTTLKHYVNKMLHHRAILFLTINEKDDNEHIGNVKVGPIDQTNRSAGVGIILGNKNYWNKGYATETIKAVERYSFEKLKLNKLFAGCLATNYGSINVFLKAGFLQEAKLREHEKVGARYVDILQFGYLKSDYLRDSRK